MRLTKEEFIDALDNYKNMLRKSNSVADAMKVKNLYSDEFLQNYYNMIIRMSDIPDKEFNQCLGCDIDIFVYIYDFGENAGKDIPDFKSAESLYDRLVKKQMED